MGFFDKVKNAFGHEEAKQDTTVPPSQLLREAGLDPSGLKFGFGTGTISVSGTIADEADRARIVEVLSGIPSISSVEDHMTVAPPAEPEPEVAPPPEAPQEIEPEAAEPTAEPESAAPEEETGRTYTVKSGDSLWKIAEQAYGNGSKYPKIFEANRDILDDPDKIFPGQVLKIPDLDD